MPSGLALIDKPAGWTSHDVVAKLRGIAGTKRVGHAGTLDPMATGLLIIGIDAGTKLLTFIVGEDKTYEATIRLGASTITDDAEGDVVDYGTLESCTDTRIAEEIAKLTGVISQVPSSVSAIKVNGKRAYAKVRGGEEVKLAAREIAVSEFALLAEPSRVSKADHDFIDIKVRVTCSSGTYIRALARDLGQALGSLGHLTALRRTRIGGYLLNDSQSMDGLTRENLAITPMLDAVAAFEIRELSAAEEVDLRHGKRIARGSANASVVAGVHADRVVAMLETKGEQLKSLVVFAEEAK